MPADRSSPSNRPSRGGGRSSGRPSRSDSGTQRGSGGRGAQKRSSGSSSGRSGPPTRRADDRSGAPRGTTPRRDEPLTDDEIRRRKAMANWGSVARKGARNVTYERNDIDRELLPPDKVWEFKDDGVHRHSPEEFRDQVETAVNRAKTSLKSPPARERSILRPRPPVPLQNALRKSLGPDMVARNLRRINDAAEEYADEHLEGARKILTPVLRAAPGIAEVRELSGLINYRLGKWKAAIEDLEAFRDITGSAEQHPVLADCYRAIGHWDDVDVLWLELGEQSPNSAIVTEGRIVTAGALADRGRVTDAVRMLEKGWKVPKRPGEHHLRRAYALADLYERSGAHVRARDLFTWISGHDARFADVKARLKS